ncbi:hypothetical protein BDZ89DRAFT_1136127 [Hymenopellis radicata]|nr:hypothetical protein BDZ89DRAFT_1136127 [Hymenopellis radicata]
MSANLKRNRENESQPPKARKVSAVPSHGSEEESEKSENAADEEEEWGGVSAPATKEISDLALYILPTDSMNGNFNLSLSIDQ